MRSRVLTQLSVGEKSRLRVAFYMAAVVVLVNSGVLMVALATERLSQLAIFYNS